MEHPLRTFRQRAGIKMDDFARQIGVSKASLSRIENGIQNVPLDRARKITLATGGEVTANDLVRSLAGAPE